MQKIQQTNIRTNPNVSNEIAFPRQPTRPQPTANKFIVAKTTFVGPYFPPGNPHSRKLCRVLSQEKKKKTISEDKSGQIFYLDLFLEISFLWNEGCRAVNTTPLCHLPGRSHLVLVHILPRTHPVTGRLPGQGCYPLAYY